MRAPLLGTHAERLERWMGREAVEHLSMVNRRWYGPPIAVAGVEGNVWACGGGDFRGPIAGGRFASAQDAVESTVRRLRRGYRRMLRNSLQLNTGFASLSDLIAEATAGKQRFFQFQKVGTTGVVGVSSSLWGVGNLPAAGANASAAPGGDAPTDATTGGFPFGNPTGPDTQHFVTAYALANLVNTLLLYDRIFQVNKTMASTATEAVTGVPTRYQSTTPGNMDYAAGNFLFVEVGGTALAATAHNWTVCLYTDQGGASSTLPSLTGRSAAAVRQFDHAAANLDWFAPLASGDTGIQQLDQMQCSASVATGVINFVIGHPIAFFPIPLINTVFVIDGINSAFNLVRVFDDAALALLEVVKPATGATTYSGQFCTVAG